MLKNCYVSHAVIIAYEVYKFPYTERLIKYNEVETNDQFDTRCVRGYNLTVSCFSFSESICIMYIVWMLLSYIKIYYIIQIGHCFFLQFYFLLNFLVDKKRFLKLIKTIKLSEPLHCHGRK